MCGIYGFVAAAGDLGPPERTAATLDAMDRSIHHRGPDDSGRYVDERCAMGMRRLSIIDLGGGKQPIASEDGRYWIVFNGEIYNYRTLREQLLARGHRFTTTSDTEVIVHWFEERGAAVVDALEGMFGFAVWDRQRHALVLARDRLGIKPLYYAPTPRGLVFGSELKSLLCHPDVRRAVSPEALTPLPVVRHHAVGSVDPRWRTQAPARPHPALLRGRAVGHALLGPRRPAARARRRRARSRRRGARAVARGRRASHLVADVPVGAFLSGGIDSASIVGTMAELGARPKTFSIGFEEADYNELEYARVIAARVRHRPPRAGGPPGRVGADRAARLVSRRAVRRRQRHPHLPRVAARRRRTSRSCSRAMAATKSSPATIATPGPWPRSAASAGCLAPPARR